MTKKSVLKLATAALVFLFAANVVNAQVEDDNYVEIDEVITHHTVGRTLGFYVEPDAAYNPNYTAGGLWTLNPKSGWTWSYSDAEANLDPVDNYVQITDLAVGNWMIEVFETNDDLDCDGGVVDERVVILPAPTMEVNAGAVGFGDECGDLEDHTISFSLTAATLANDLISAQWRLKTYPVTIDASGDPELDLDSEAIEVFLWNKFDESPQTIGGQDWTMTENSSFVGDGTNPPALAAYTLSMTRDYNLPGGNDAYLYRWEIELGEDDGINDRISRKSDYIDSDLAINTDDYTIYGTAGTIDIYVVRAPVTGPIYHIPNAFGN